jgi:hypothetical protein
MDEEWLIQLAQAYSVENLATIFDQTLGDALKLPECASSTP